MSTSQTGLNPFAMLNAFDVIRANPTAKVFEIGGLLFAQFQCPAEEHPVGIWAQMDHFLHVLSGTNTWKTSAGTCSAETGETVFFKKGAFIMPQHFEKDLCVELFFIPDRFIRETVIELAPDLPLTTEPFVSANLTIPVNNDVALSAFFHAMTIYFAGNEEPREALLKLKLRELITSILLGRSNRELSAYFRAVASSDAPSIPQIMEMNFCHNLSMEAFAQMCHRSVSSFKRDFRKHYGTSPGRWLVERRLQHAACLLQNTQLSVTEVAFECGFEEVSHFSRAFKEKFHQSPSGYRDCV